MNTSFSLVVKAGKTEDIDIPLGANLVLTNAALEATGNKDTAKIILNHGENKLTICTLIAGVIPQYRMKVLVSQPDDEDEDEDDMNEEKDEEDKELPPPSITVEGKGTVYLTGSFVPAFEDDEYGFDDEDDYDDDDDDDMDDVDGDDDDEDDGDDDDDDDDDDE